MPINFYCICCLRVAIHYTRVLAGGDMRVAKDKRVFPKNLLAKAHMRQTVVCKLTSGTWCALGKLPHLVFAPINVLYPDKPNPIILALTSMDSASFFCDKNLGAESPLSWRHFLERMLVSILPDRWVWWENLTFG